MTTVYAGIDPGVTGAVVTLEDGELEFFDTPSYRDGKRTKIDPVRCAEIIRKIDSERGNNPLVVAIEHVHPMPKNGSIGCFGLGYSFGLWIGILVGLDIPFSTVSPQKWKNLLMAGQPKEKDASRAVARRLWPDQTEEALSRKKDHNRAEAALIAEYARRVL